MTFSAELFRAEFGYFRQHPDWIYLDNAATMQKPAVVLEAIQQFYLTQNSNVHRSAHYLSQLATQAFEQSRRTIAQFLNAGSSHQVIFQSGATAAFNQLVFGLTGTVLNRGDRVLLTVLEHHANLVPWQLHAKSAGIELDFVPLDQENRLDLDAYQQLLQRKPKVVSFAQVSNALGHIQPIEQMIKLAKAAGALVVVDGAQGVVWQQPDLQALDIDAYIFSGHKLYGPTGIGVLCAKTALLEQLKPLFGGGEMIQHVSLETVSFAALPYRLEAGTPNMAGAIGLAAAVNWLQQQDLDGLKLHKTQLITELYAACMQIPQIELLSQPNLNAGILLFNLKNEHPADVAELLNQFKLAARAGSHCAMPLFQYLNCNGAVRLSLAGYTTTAEIAQVIAILKKLPEFF
ncbi:aminotransferase class V-fold PLP-dependent enzyme [Rheinheimera sp.]|uniref:aminotransferase class V-fold PLP-dependent enzyme n=1 Tax=Rheinheimera sp. TaxID=1869214 RepID=UPI003AF4308A